MNTDITHIGHAALCNNDALVSLTLPDATWDAIEGTHPWLMHLRPAKGTTLRDYFAAAAMQGKIASFQGYTVFDAKNIALFSYAIADAMISQRTEAKL